MLHEHTLPSTNRGAPPTAPRLRELHVRHNPHYRHYERSASAATAVRLSDICDVAAFARTELAWAIGWSDAPYSMQLQVRRESMVSSYVTLDRAGREFSRRDRQVLSLLRPLLLAYETSLALRLEIERLLAESLPDPGIERRLTRREREILDLVAIGASNAVIAHQLAISPQTVRKHLENAYLKLEVNSRTEALARTGRAKSTASR